jgi:uncharacterized membrane protein HdeD (DUF308 family)
MLSRNWGWVVLRGIVAILFGMLTVSKPSLAQGVLVLMFGAYALVDGVFMVASAVANRQGERRWGALLVAGLFGIAIGIVTFVWPEVTGIALLAMIAIWAIGIGIAEIVAAIDLRKVITGEFWFILSGIVSVAFGTLVIMAPAKGALAITLWIGMYALIAGFMLVALGIRLRSWGRHVHAALPHPA